MREFMSVFCSYMFDRTFYNQSELPRSMHPPSYLSIHVSYIYVNKTSVIDTLRTNYALFRKFLIIHCLL